MLVVQRVRALCFRGPVDVDAMLDGVRKLGAANASPLFARLEGAFAADAIAPIASREAGGDLGIALEESLAMARRGVLRGLAALRIAASVSTCLGFVGAATALHWVNAGDHGILGLDATLVTSIGTNRAALAIALGLGGSSLAIGSWVTLRACARRRMGEVDRAFERALRLAKLDRPIGSM